MFTFAREAIITSMTKPGIKRPVVIPRKKQLKEDIVLSVGRTIGLTRSDIEDRLSKRKKR